MANAKFHVVGEDGTWYRMRIQEEIYTQGLEGSVVKASDDVLAVIVEGEKPRIHSMYKTLKESSPGQAHYTDIQWGAHRRFRQDKDKLEEIIQLLKAIEKNTRRISQKMGGVQFKGKTDREERDKEEAGFKNTYTPVKKEESKDEEDEEEAAGGFASMFGD